MEGNMDDTSVAGRVTRARRKRLESDGGESSTSRPSTPLAAQVKMDPIPENTPTKRITRRNSITHTPKTTPLPKTPLKSANTIGTETGDATPTRITRRRSISSAAVKQGTQLSTLSEEKTKSSNEKNSSKHSNTHAENDEGSTHSMESDIIVITDTDQESNEDTKVTKENFSPKPKIKSEPEIANTMAAKMSPVNSTATEQKKLLSSKSVKFDNDDNQEMSKTVYPKTPTSFKKKTHVDLSSLRKMSIDLDSEDSVVFVGSISPNKATDVINESECLKIPNGEEGNDSSDTLVIDPSPEKFLRSGKNYGESPSPSKSKTSGDSMPEHSPNNRRQQPKRSIEMMTEASEDHETPIHDSKNESHNISKEKEDSSAEANVEPELINNNKNTAKTSNNTSIDALEKSSVNESANDTKEEEESNSSMITVLPTNQVSHLALQNENLENTIMATSITSDQSKEDSIDEISADQAAEKINDTDISKSGHELNVSNNEMTSAAIKSPSKEIDLPKDSDLLSPTKVSQNKRKSNGAICDDKMASPEKISTVDFTTQPKATLVIAETVKLIPGDSPDALKLTSPSKMQHLHNIKIDNTIQMAITPTSSPDSHTKTTKLAPSIESNFSNSSSMEKISSTTSLGQSIDEPMDVDITLPEENNLNSPLKQFDILEHVENKNNQATEIQIQNIIEISPSKTTEATVDKLSDEQIIAKKAFELSDEQAIESINASKPNEKTAEEVSTPHNRRDSVGCVTTTVDFESKNTSLVNESQFEKKIVETAKDGETNVQATSSREVTSSWTHSVRRQSDKIDAITASLEVAPKATEPQLNEKRTEKVSICSNESNADYQMNVETDEEDADEENDNNSDSENSFVDNEAMDAGKDYESGDSMNSEEKDLYAEHQVDCEHGESIGSQDTDEEEDECYDENDSFIAPSDEESVESAKFSAEEDSLEQTPPKQYKRLVLMESDSEEEGLLQINAAGESRRLKKGDLNCICTHETDEVNDETNCNADFMEPLISVRATADDACSKSSIPTPDKNAPNLSLPQNSSFEQTSEQITDVPKLQTAEETNETTKSSECNGDTSMNSSASSVHNSSGNDSNIEQELRDLIEANVLDGPVMRQSRRKTLGITTQDLEEMAPMRKRHTLHKTENSGGELSQSFVDSLKMQNRKEEPEAGKRKLSLSFTGDQQTTKKAKHDTTLQTVDETYSSGKEAPKSIGHILQRCNEIMNESNQQKLLAKKLHKANVKKKHVPKVSSDDTQSDEEAATSSQDHAKKQAALKGAFEASNKILQTKHSRNAHKGKISEHSKATLEHKALKNISSKDNEANMPAMDAKKANALTQALMASQKLLNSQPPKKERKTKTAEIVSSKFESKKLPQDFLEALEQNSQATSRKRKRNKLSEDHKTKVYETKTGLVTETILASPPPTKMKRRVQVLKMKTGPVFVELASPIRVKKSRFGFEETPGSPFNPGWKVDMVHNKKHHWLENKAGTFKVEKISEVEMASGSHVLATDAAERARNFLKTTLNHNVKREDARQVLRSKKFIQ